MSGYGRWNTKLAYIKLPTAGVVGTGSAVSAASTALAVSDLPSPNPGRTYDENTYARALSVAHHDDEILLETRPSVELKFPVAAKVASDFLVSLFQNFTEDTSPNQFFKTFTVPTVEKHWKRGDSLVLEAPHIIDIVGQYPGLPSAGADEDWLGISGVVTRVRLAKEGGLLTMSVTLMFMGLSFTNYEYTGTVTTEWNGAANTSWITNLFARVATGTGATSPAYLRTFEMDITNNAVLDLWLNDTPQNVILAPPRWGIEARVALSLDQATALAIHSNYQTRAHQRVDVYGPLTTSNFDANPPTAGDFFMQVRGRITNPTFHTVSSDQIDTSFTLKGNYTGAVQPVTIKSADNVDKSW